jgi:biopolymer transport protein ExbD
LGISGQPTAPAKPTANTPLPVAGDGQLFFQGSRVTLPELAKKFDEAARNDAATTVYIRVDRGTLSQTNQRHQRSSAVRLLLIFLLSVS